MFVLSYMCFTSRAALLDTKLIQFSVNCHLAVGYNFPVRDVLPSAKFGHGSLPQIEGWSRPTTSGIPDQCPLHPSSFKIATYSANCQYAIPHLCDQNWNRSVAFVPRHVGSIGAKMVCRAWFQSMFPTTWRKSWRHCTSSFRSSDFYNLRWSDQLQTDHREFKEACLSHKFHLFAWNAFEVACKH